jgi:hypothetical protein
MLPVFVNRARQFQTIDRPWQLDIGEQDADIWPMRQDIERSVASAASMTSNPRSSSKSAA